MPDEPTDPPLSLASTSELIRELGGRYKDYVFAGRRPAEGDADADDGRFTISLIGNTDTIAGLVARLGMAARMRMRVELEEALGRDADADD